MTFHELAVGDPFLFMHDAVSARPDTDVVRFRVKRSDRTFDTHWGDGTQQNGRVGVGDNPVYRLDREITQERL